MASRRRALTAGFTFFNRRNHHHHPFPHLLPHDRDRHDPNHSRSFSSFRLGHGNGSFGADPFLSRRSYSSASAAPIAGEVAVAAADSYLPVAALQHLIDGVHSLAGLNWWASIAVTTVLIRCVTIPFMLSQMRSTVKLNEMRPEIEQLKEQMQTSTDPDSLQQGRKQMTALFRKHGVTPFTPLKGLFIQGPIFVSFFLAISNMAEKVPSFKDGGLYWFTDLSTPDPLYALPILTGLTFLTTVELNMQDGMEGNPMVNTYKKYSRVFAFVTVPLTASFPKAIFFYWITSNVFSIAYGFVIRRPQIRRLLNLPQIALQPAPAQPKFDFLGESKITKEENTKADESK